MSGRHDVQRAALGVLKLKAGLDKIVHRSTVDTSPEAASAESSMTPMGTNGGNGVDWGD